MIVVGTGPAGLTAAYLLAKRGHQVTLCDAAADPGGLWAGWEDKGRYFEKGMHNYCSVGIAEIDDFYNELPIIVSPLEGNHRDVAGVYWEGKLNTLSPYIDLTADPANEKMFLDLMWSAYARAPTSERAMDAAQARFGGWITRNHIGPILRKLYGTSQLQARALDLTNLHRVMISHSEDLVGAMIKWPALRERIAWPNQLTLPAEYNSGRKGFYPSEGMRALVTAALGKLASMGVDIQIGVPPFTAIEEPIVWAAGLPRLAKALGINMPPVESRSLTVVNLAGPVSAGPLHYFFCYQEHLKTFRVTCYQNFSLFDQTSVEMFDTPAAGAGEAAIAELKEMGVLNKHTRIPEVVGVHELGPVLPLPTASNDALLDHLRLRLQRPGLHLVGAGARNGLFFQPDVLKHVWHTVHCVIGEARTPLPHVQV